jgi:hypothetical protein
MPNIQDLLKNNTAYMRLLTYFKKMYNEVSVLNIVENNDNDHTFEPVELFMMTIKLKRGVKLNDHDSSELTDIFITSNDTITKDKFLTLTPDFEKIIKDDVFKTKLTYVKSNIITITDLLEINRGLYIDNLITIKGYKSAEEIKKAKSDAENTCPDPTIEYTSSTKEKLSLKNAQLIDSNIPDPTSEQNKYALSILFYIPREIGITIYLLSSFYNSPTYYDEMSVMNSILEYVDKCSKDKVLFSRSEKYTKKQITFSTNPISTTPIKKALKSTPNVYTTYEDGKSPSTTTKKKQQFRTDVKTLTGPNPKRWFWGGTRKNKKRKSNKKKTRKRH